MFVQIPTAPMNDFATVIVALAGVAAIALMIKNLFFNKPLAEQAITRSEFVELRTKVEICEKQNVSRSEYIELKSKVETCEKQCINKAEYTELKSLCATKDSVDGLKTDVIDIRKYVQEKHHKLSDDMHAMGLNLERLRLEIHKELELSERLVLEKLEKILFNITKTDHST